MAEEKKASDQKKRLSREEAVERRINLARERGARVLVINSFSGNTVVNIAQQFDKIQKVFHDRIGQNSERGLSYEEGRELLNKATDAMYLLSEVTQEMADKIGFRYYIPEEVEFIKSKKDGAKTTTTP